MIIFKYRKTSAERASAAEQSTSFVDYQESHILLKKASNKNEKIGICKVLIFILETSIGKWNEISVIV